MIAHLAGEFDTPIQLDGCTWPPARCCCWARAPRAPCCCSADKAIRPADLQRTPIDATNRLRTTEARLYEVLTRYQTYWEHAPECLFAVRVTESGEFIYEGINPANERLTGFRNSEVSGKTPRECLPPAIADVVLARYHACVETATNHRPGRGSGLPARQTAHARHADAGARSAHQPDFTHHRQRPRHHRRPPGHRTTGGGAGRAHHHQPPPALRPRQHQRQLLHPRRQPRHHQHERGCIALVQHQPRAGRRPLVPGDHAAVPARGPRQSQGDRRRPLGPHRIRFELPAPLDRGSSLSVGRRHQLLLPRHLRTQACRADHRLDQGPARLLARRHVGACRDPRRDRHDRARQQLLAGFPARAEAGHRQRRHRARIIWRSIC